MNLVRQQFIPVRCHPNRTGDWSYPDGATERPTAGRGSGHEWQTDWPLFYDTCAGLYQAGLGTPFTEQQDAAFEHLHCGTYADQITPHLSLPDLAAAHRAIYAQPEMGRGLKAQQDKYYALRRPGRSATNDMNAKSAMNKATERK